jgi:hypothetical protein
MDEKYGPTQIKNEFRAVDPSHAAERSRHLARRALQRATHDIALVEGGAIFDQHGILHPTKEQIESLYKQYEAPEKENAKAQPASTETDSITSERLKEIVNSSIYLANPYIKGQENIKFNGLNGDNRAGILESLKHSFPSKEIEKPFTDVGISELVTVAEISQFEFRDSARADSMKWPSGPHKDEPIYAVQYMTLTANAEPVPDETAPRGMRHKQKFEYLENRQGHLDKLSDEELAVKGLDREKLTQMKQNNRLSEFNYTLLLPQTVAKELNKAMRARPQLARELGDILVLNPDAEQGWIAILDAWEDWKPPYEKWREVNDGVNRMAFRTASDQSVDQSTIVEF